MPRRNGFYVLALLFALLAVSIIPTFAAPPSNDDVSLALGTHLPASGTITDIEEADLEPGEPTASCATDTGGAVGPDDDDSVWFRINVPAGTLTFATTTVEASFDTVISLYNVPSITDFSLLVELACAVNPGNAATLTTAVAGGEYYVRVASDDGLPLGSRTLNYTASFTAKKASLIPANDDVASAKQVVFNKSSKVKNWEFATRAATDPTPTCATRPPSSTLWYTFTGASGATLITAEGSVLKTSTSDVVAGPGIAIYTGTPGSLVEAGCNDNLGLNSAGRVLITTTSPTVLYVMVYTDFPAQDLTAPSVAKLLVAPGRVEVVTNGDFDEALTGWKVKNSTNEAIANGAGTPNLNNAFRFDGGPGENSQLTQKIVIPKTLYIPADSVMSFKYQVKSGEIVTPPNSISVELTLVYADGKTVKQKQALALPVTPFVTNGFGYDFLIVRKAPVKILLAVRSKAADGDVSFDNIFLEIKALSPLRSEAGVLPLPPAPGR